MKKVLIKSLGLTLSVIALLLVSGCSVIGKPIGNCIGASIEVGEHFSSGDFVYCYIRRARASEVAKSGDYIAIIGLTDEGKQKETIIIPEEIEGKPVIQIGMTGFAFIDSIATYASYTRLYLPSTVIYFGADVGCNGINSRLFALKLNEQLLYKARAASCSLSSIYVSKEVYEDLEDKEKDIHLQIAKVSYYVDDEVYWLDDGNKETEKKIIEPPIPTKDGYEFCGWYKEPKLINKWDFEKDMAPPNKDVSKDNLTNLYAKFEKIN